VPAINFQKWQARSVAQHFIMKITATFYLKPVPSNRDRVVFEGQGDFSYPPERRRHD
jgi:hypothetical protein